MPYIFGFLSGMFVYMGLDLILTGEIVLVGTIGTIITAKHLGTSFLGSATIMAIYAIIDGVKRYR